MSRGRYFFATANDLIPGLRRFEEARAVQYVLIGNFESRDFAAGARLTQSVQMSRTYDLRS